MALNQNLANIKKLTPFKESRSMSRDYFSKSRKLSTIWCRFKERKSSNNILRLEWLFIALQENIMRENMILNAQI